MVGARYRQALGVRAGGGATMRSVCFEGGSTGEAKMREWADALVRHDAEMIGGFLPLPRCAGNSTDVARAPFNSAHRGDKSRA
jgi:hypothetical protein